MPCNLTYTWNRKKLNSQEQRVEQGFPGARGWADWEDVGQMTQISVR